LKRRMVKHSDQLRDGCSELLAEEGFTFDIRVKGAQLPAQIEDVQLIKVNAFGPNSHCGSALFHWIKDWKILTGESGEYAEMRIVARPEPSVSV